MPDQPTASWYDAAALGVEVESGVVRFAPEDVAAYRRVTGLLLGPQDRDGRGVIAHGSPVPPGLIILSLTTFSRGLNPRVGSGSGISIVGQHLELHAPVQVGDELIARAAVSEVYRKTGRSGEMTFINTRTRLLDARGAVVATLVHRYTWHEHPEWREAGVAR